MFYYCTQYCNSVSMTCSIKRLLIFILSFEVDLSYIARHIKNNKTANLEEKTYKFKTA